MNRAESLPPYLLPFRLLDWLHLLILLLRLLLLLLGSAFFLLLPLLFGLLLLRYFHFFWNFYEAYKSTETKQISQEHGTKIT